MRSVAEQQALDSVDEPLSMDDELYWNVFNSKAAGLETMIGKIPQYKREANSIQDLLELYGIIQILNPEKNDDSDDEGILGKKIAGYRNGDSMLSPNDASESSVDKDKIFRNRSWVPNILKHHSFLKGPVLFGIGAGHLEGEHGLLALLPAEGFAIQHLKPNGYFEDYTYPFTSYFASNLSLVRERHMFSWTTEVSDYKRAILHHYTQLSSADTQLVRDYLGEDDNLKVQPARNLSFFQRLQQALLL